MASSHAGVHWKMEFLPERLNPRNILNKPAIVVTESDKLPYSTDISGSWEQGDGLYKTLVGQQASGSDHVAQVLYIPPLDG